MSAEDQLYRSLQRHSRLRVDKIAQDLSFRHTPLSDIHASLLALDSGRKALRPVPESATQGAIFQDDLQLTAIHGAREMTREWMIEEERVGGHDNARREESLANATTTPEHTICRDLSFATRRRLRYRSIPQSVRLIAPPDSPSGAPTDEDEAVQEPQNERGVELGDEIVADALKPLLQVRRIRKLDIARSTVEYLQLEARLKAASLLCCAITTAEQEKRTKQRARIWRRDVGTLKARHVRALTSAEPQPDHQLQAPRDATEVVSALLGRYCGLEQGIDEDTIAQHDSLVDRVYETLLKENVSDT